MYKDANSPSDGKKNLTDTGSLTLMAKKNPTVCPMAKAVIQPGESHGHQHSINCYPSSSTKTTLHLMRNFVLGENQFDASYKVYHC